MPRATSFITAEDTLVHRDIIASEYKDEEFDAEEAAEADEDDIELLDDYEYVD